MFFFLSIRRPQESTLSYSSAASDVYKGQRSGRSSAACVGRGAGAKERRVGAGARPGTGSFLIQLSEPTRPHLTSYVYFSLKKKN